MAENRRQNSLPQQVLDFIINQHLLVIIFLSASLLILFGFFMAFSRANRQQVTALAPMQAPVVSTENTGVPVRTMLQRLPQTTGPLRIGIISGHLDSDAGAVCDDGLTENQVNLGISEKVVALLQGRGFEVDLLSEFDDRLNGYDGFAVIAIQADSCTGPGALLSGYKIANSGTERASMLQLCVQEIYGARTQIAYNIDTITPDMLEYHAFRKVAPTTPAIIIETGFMNLDRELLTTNNDIPSGAIVEGLICFAERAQ